MSTFPKHPHEAIGMRRRSANATNRSETSVEDRDAQPAQVPRRAASSPRRYLSHGKRVHDSTAGNQAGNPQGTGGGSRVCQLGTPTNQKKSGRKEEPSFQGVTG